MLISQKIAAKKASLNLEPHSDLVNLSLKNPFKWPKDILQEAINQYKISEKISLKIPSWSKNSDLLGANLLNIEQCSSEISAIEKFKHYEGKLAIDLTGGFGVDSYFLSKNFQKVIYCEANRDLYEIVKHNFSCLGVTNVEFYNELAEDFIQKYPALKPDLFYADPDRRSSENKKLIQVTDCKPDMEALSNILLHRSSHLLIKYSPMLDISLALKSLPNCEKVSSVAIQNEVKELLFNLTLDATKDPIIEAKNLDKENWQLFQFTNEQEQKAIINYSGPLKYMYEPNAAILKTGAFKSIAVLFDLQKLAVNSHFYTSEKLITDFPGRALKVNAVFGTSSKELRVFKNQKVNVISRNYPIGPDDIKKKYQILDGGDSFLLFTQTNAARKIAIFVDKINQQ